MWFFSDSSFAAASAPVRAAWNTGLLELFAMTAMRMVLSFFAWARAPEAACCFGSPAEAAIARTRQVTVDVDSGRYMIGSPREQTVEAPGILAVLRSGDRKS